MADPKAALAALLELQLFWEHESRLVQAVPRSRSFLLRLRLDATLVLMTLWYEFDTAVRYRWPLLLVVANNDGLVAEYMVLERRDMEADLAMVPSPDFAALGRAFGGKGHLVRTLDELRAATKEWVADPCPMIIDAKIAPHVRSIRFLRGLGQDVHVVRGAFLVLEHQRDRQTRERRVADLPALGLELRRAIEQRRPVGRLVQERLHQLRGHRFRMLDANGHAREAKWTLDKGRAD